jgi:hypothetical protein
MGTCGDPHVGKPKSRLFVGRHCETHPTIEIVNKFALSYKFNLKLVNNVAAVLLQNCINMVNKHLIVFINRVN